MAKRPHNFDGLFCGFRVCVRCGLIWLRNAVTAKAIKAACPGADEDK